MPRRKSFTDLTTPNARKRLKPQKGSKPYWFLVSGGRHLGYRPGRGKNAGTWCARAYVGDGIYREHALGVAADHSPTASGRALTFDTAREEAARWFAATLDTDEEARGPYTVRECMRDYLAWYRAHRKSIHRVTYTVEAHILPVLGDIEVAKLTKKRIERWHQDLAVKPRRLRTRPGDPQKTKDAETPEEVRRRKATANRVLSVLKAGLNRKAPASADDIWRKVKPFKGAEKPRIDRLTGDEAVRLLNGCESDFRLLAKAALLTGCRYGELIAMKARDFDPDALAVYIIDPKSGRPRWVHLSDEGRQFFESVTVGRGRERLCFLRADGLQWGKSHQARRMTKACESAGLRRIGFHTLRHTYGSQLAQAGATMKVIAEQLGHADTRITERHYAHLAPSHVGDVIRAALPRLEGDRKSTVVRIAAQP